MNIILLVFDSLRKDCVGCYGQPPWGRVQTPRLDALSKESLVMDAMYPESLPTLPTRRALYTGQRVYPFHKSDFRLKGDFVGAPGWGPIPESQATLAEILQASAYRTALVSDVYHQFKPSKNYWRGFDQWVFLRGQETDKYRSGPEPTDEEMYHWLPKEFHDDYRTPFIRQCIKNMYGRDKEEDYFAPRVLTEAAHWLEQNRDADNFFLTIESFDPHEPWFVPEHYRKMYDPTDGPEWVISGYQDTKTMPANLLKRAQSNYSGLVTMCDRWFGFLYDTIRTLGLLENTLLIVTADHGHSIGDNDFLGKRGYPSHTSVYDVPLFIRHPEGIGAGKRSGMMVQHTDVAAQVLDFAGVQSPEPIDGKPFWKAAIEGGPALKEHVTVGWNATVTVFDGRWWLNCKIDSTGGFLYDTTADPGLTTNVAEQHPDEYARLFQLAVEDAAGGYPDYLREMCAKQADAPGCSALVARE